MVIGIEYTDWEGCFDAGDSVLFQGGVYTIHHPPHRFRSKTRLKEYSTRQVTLELREFGGFEMQGTVGARIMYIRLEVF